MEKPYSSGNTTVGMECETTSMRGKECEIASPRGMKCRIASTQGDRIHPRAICLDILTVWKREH